MTEMQGDIISSATSSDTYDTVGGRIYRAREASGLSPAQLARRLGIKTATLHAWENDKSEPRSNKLVMLSGILNVSPSWLMIGAGESPGVGSEGADQKIEDVRYELIQLHKQSKEITDRIQTLLTQL